ncbi:hypothetical protein CQW23_31600 [Capsicum baccatum]|uniref:Uncharacterized protein n=1 Tax=Capsicum baccatum TaxID=33114 RepID=A0A2G2V724_CAPBA|nr:hypothetical protein CQW23_31600 [Capsicum baccatum]
MEGLIPFLLHAMKKQEPQHKSFRCHSGTSNQDYHMLVGGDSVEGSSHRRTQLQSPVSTDFLYLPQPKSFSNRTSILFSPVSNQNGSRQQFGSNMAATSSLQATATVDNLRHRKFRCKRLR